LQLINEGKEWNLTPFPSLNKNVVCRAVTNPDTLFRTELIPVTGYEAGSYWVNAEMLSDEDANNIMQGIATFL